MVSDYQFDPLKTKLHIDFLAINMTEERTVDVPVHLVGEGGAKEGGVEQPLFDLQVTNSRKYP